MSPKKHGKPGVGLDLYNLHGADSVATELAYHRMFHERLPQIVEQHSATLYWPSSPTHDWDLPVRSSNSGDEHAWSVWFDTLDFSFFSEHVGRFASEYGLQESSRFVDALYRWSYRL